MTYRTTYSQILHARSTTNNTLSQT